MFADVFHSIRFSLFRVTELVNPDRLRHMVPPGSASTVAYEQTPNTCPEGQMCSVGTRLDIEAQACGFREHPNVR